jgi:high frequency lysogenization protein
MTDSAVHLRTLALAGVFQAATLVKQLAKTGRIDFNSEALFLASIQSIFSIHAQTALEVYQSPQNLRLGLEEVIRLFVNNKLPKDPEIARYAFSLLHLEKKLSANPKMLKTLRTGIERAATQANYFSPTHENVMANLASLYTDTISTFSFRIHVTGEPAYLNRSQTMNQVRALLLAGVRSAVLWQQLGGRRWQLLIARSSLLESAKEWLNTQVSELV